MKTINPLTSACRLCQYYKPEGRRGGTCQQLGVPVQSNWEACALALPPFAPTWESLEKIIVWSNGTLPVLPTAAPITVEQISPAEALLV